ncbi:MAG: hypothetical protein Q4C91_02140 [Eubacteriales bacterium]|nr:hypothetical protein [Eubacteriales bacterium]
MSGKECSKTITVLGHGITIHVYDTGAGINILIEGGEKGHIGAVAVAESGKAVAEISFPSHKEGIVCKKWAETVSRSVSGPVVVEAGIHYNNITEEGIREVLGALDKELECLLEQLKSAAFKK